MIKNMNYNKMVSRLIFYTIIVSPILAVVKGGCTLEQLFLG